MLGADAQALPFPDATFDAVLCVNVLEAVPQRDHALAEMHRVLKPGGCVLVAHDDYESQVYTCSDRELGRRIVLAYAESTFASYATSDGQMGRHLWGVFSAAGFRNPELHVLPLVNTVYCEPWHGWVISQFTANFISRVSDLTDEELTRWRADLAERSAAGHYTYCLNLYVCRGWK
jgi:SAM-dependent methyltransferase